MPKNALLSKIRARNKVYIDEAIRVRPALERDRKNPVVIMWADMEEVLAGFTEAQKITPVLASTTVKHERPVRGLARQIGLTPTQRTRVLEAVKSKRATRGGS